MKSIVSILVITIVLAVVQSVVCAQESSVLNNNARLGNGGGIGLSYSSPMIKNTTLKENHAFSAFGSYSGGIWCSAANPTLINLLIINNEVSAEEVFGGGIAFIGSEPAIENATIYTNPDNSC